MGKISSGILGGFSGKVGNVVGGSWKGIDYMRIKPASVANPRTEGQVDQRTKFRTVLNFLQPSTGFIQVGFRNYAIKMTAFNAAMSYNLNNAIDGMYPDYFMSYENVLLSRGKLTGFESPNVSGGGMGQVHFNWMDNIGSGNAKANDKIGYLLYLPDAKESIFGIDVVDRQSGTITVNIPGQYSGQNAHGFLMAISADGKEISDSAYVGSTVI